MASLIQISTFSDSRGDLSVIDKELPFKIKRVFYIYNTKEKRGGHRHHKSTQALISLGGTSKIYIYDGIKQSVFNLTKPSQCLIVEPQDWHTMELASPSTFLLVLASEYYEVKDYIYENYPYSK